MKTNLKKYAGNVLWIATVGFFLLTCSDEPVSVQTKGHIKGRVLDADTGQGIPQVVITTAPPTVSITTDSSGNFLLENLDAGTYTITASKKDYEKVSVSVAVREGDTTIADILMSATGEQNSPPYPPSNPKPENGASQQPTELTLQWAADDPDPGDSLTFDVYFYPASSPPTLAASGLEDTSYQVSQLRFNSIYYWQIVARDSKGASTNGAVWSFTTLPFPNNPVLFTSERDGDFDVYSASPDTLDTRIIRLSQLSSREWWPRFSPGRDKIAFTSDAEVEPQIYTMDPDGSNVFRVTTIPVAGYYNYGIGFCWSPDGTQLLYSHYEKLYRINADRSGLTQIATAPPNRHFREVEWSPLGNKIVALTMGSWFYDSEIYLMNPDGSDMQQLVGNLPGAVENPSFSPDGQKIVFTHDVSGFQSSTNRQLDSHIFIINVDGSDTTDVSSGKPAGTNDFNPRFSPDGSKIIFCNAPNDNSAAADIWIMNVDGSDRRKIITDGSMPDWR